VKYLHRKPIAILASFYEDQFMTKSMIIGSSDKPLVGVHGLTDLQDCEVKKTG